MDIAHVSNLMPGIWRFGCNSNFSSFPISVNHGGERERPRPQNRTKQNKTHFLQLQRKTPEKFLWKHVAEWNAPGLLQCPSPFPYKGEEDPHWPSSLLFPPPPWSRGSGRWGWASSWRLTCPGRKDRSVSHCLYVSPPWSQAGLPCCPLLLKAPELGSGLTQQVFLGWKHREDSTSESHPRSTQRQRSTQAQKEPERTIDPYALTC